MEGGPVVAMVLDTVEEVLPPQSERVRRVEGRAAEKISSGEAGLVVRFHDGSEADLGPEGIRVLLVVLAARANGQHVSIVTHDVLLSPQKAAALLGVSRPMVYRYIERGELTATRVGSHWRLRAGEVIALAMRRESQAQRIDGGLVAAIRAAAGGGRRLDAKRAWREATEEERREAESIIASLDTSP